MILKQCSSHIIGCVHWLSLCWAIQESMKRSLVTLEATKIYWNFLTCSQNVLLTLETLGILETLDSKHCKTGTQWSILTRDSFIRDSFVEVMLIRVTWLVGASPVVHKHWRRLFRRTTNHRHKVLVCATQHLCLSDRCMRLEHVLFWITQHELSLWDIHFQLNDKSVTDTSILHAEASFVSADRGLRRGILSRTSLKHCFNFSSFWSSQFSFANNSKGM